MIFLGLDLNCATSICDPAKNSLAGGIDELGQTGVRASHAAFAADHVSPLRRALWRSAQGQELFLSRPIPLHGVRSTDLSRQFARHRSVPARTSGQAVPHGHQEPGFAQHSGRCQRESRLAHLRRLCPVAHCHRPSPLCRRALWRRPQRYGLCSGCQHHRPVPVGISLGSVSLDQGGHQVAHALGPARQHPFVHPHQRWQTARRQRSGSAVARARRFLHHGPRIHRLRTARLHEAKSFFVTRAKSTLKAQRRYSHPVDRSTGLICDQTIVLTSFYPRQDFDTPLRRVRFKDPTTGKRLVFLTNNFTLPAFTITELYRCRWQVELFFKWIKQHLRIKVFFGTSENAVKTQIWIAVSVYVLVAIVKKRLNLSASLYEMLQILSLTMFERIPLDQLLNNIIANDIQAFSPNQLNLFN